MTELTYPSRVQQLSLEIQPDLRLAERGHDGWMSGALKLSGAMLVGQNLRRGERLFVTVTKRGGDQIASGLYIVEAVGFKAVKDKGTVIGTERIHTAKLEESTLSVPEASGYDPRSEGAAA